MRLDIWKKRPVNTCYPASLIPALYKQFTYTTQLVKVIYSLGLNLGLDSGLSLSLSAGINVSASIDITQY